jgi:hypothetical protein
VQCPVLLAAQGGPSARAEIWTAHLNISSPFKLGQQNLRWSSEWRGQYSPNLLMGSEQFSIGSRYTVRGFNTTSLTGQSGWVLRNELGWTVLHPLAQDARWKCIPAWMLARLPAKQAVARIRPRYQAGPLACALPCALVLLPS